MKTRCKEGTDRAKDLYDKCKQKDDLKMKKLEELDRLGLLGAIKDYEITSENYKEYLYGKKQSIDLEIKWVDLDTNMYQYKNDTTL